MLDQGPPSAFRVAPGPRINPGRHLCGLRDLRPSRICGSGLRHRATGKSQTCIVNGIGPDFLGWRNQILLNCACADRSRAPASGPGLRAPALPWPACGPALEAFAVGRLRRRHQAEIDVHGLETVGRRAAGDVAQQGAQRRGIRRRREGPSQPLGRRHAPGEQADRRALDIALDAGDLAGEAQPGIGLQAQAFVQQFRAVQEGVAVDAAEPGEARLLQPRNRPEDFGLGAVLQLGLEADHVEQGAERIVLAQLDDGMGAAAGARVGQADRFHRAEAQGLPAARRHDLDRQAAFEIGRVLLPVLEFRLVAGEQGVDEAFVLRLVQRAVDVGPGVAAGARLVVARLAPGDAFVDRVGMDDGRDGVEEGERVLAGQVEDGLRQRRRSQRPGRDDHRVPFGGRQAFDLSAPDFDQRMRLQPRLHRPGKAVPVDRQRAAGRHLVGIRRRKDERAAAPHLRVQHADGVGFGVVRAEGVGADQLGERIRLVRVRATLRPHLVEDRRNAGAGRLPRRLAARQPAADDMDGCRGGRGHHCTEFVHRMWQCKHRSAAPPVCPWEYRWARFSVATVVHSASCSCRFPWLGWHRLSRTK